MTVDALNKKLARREADAYRGIGHCGVVVCSHCQAQPHHACVALCGSAADMAERF